MTNPINRVARSKEAMLASAIQKAAALAPVSQTPREVLLADQLKAHNIGPQFANVATQAFNKRCTINFITAHNQQTRDGEFPLADPIKVLQEMTGLISKQAFLDQSFIFEIIQPAVQMTKVASVIDVVPIAQDSYAQRTTDYVRQTLDKCLNKVASYVCQYKLQLANARRLHEQQLDRFAAQLAMNKKAAHILQSLVARYGDVVSQVLKDRLPQDADLTKRASNILCIDKDTDMKCRALLVADAALTHMQNKFAKFAADMNDNMQLYAALYDRITDSQIQQGISKMAAVGLSAAAVPLLGIGSLGAVAAQQASDKLVNALLAVKGQNGDVSPDAFISTEFLLKDSDMQQRMALAEVLADRALAAYDPQDIQDAFVHALQADKSLQKPSRRELLRSTMRIRMAQNDKVSPADLAALYSTLGSIPTGQKSTAQLAAKMIKQLSPVGGKADVFDFKSLVANKPLASDKLVEGTANFANKSVGQQGKDKKKSK